MHTQNNFYKTARTKFGENPYEKRVRTSASPKRGILGLRGKLVEMPAITTNYNIQNINLMDNDKIYEELIKCKNEINKKNKDYHLLKIQFSKLDAENKRNIKLIEEVLEENMKKNDKGGNNMNSMTENDMKAMMSNINLPGSSINKLREVFIYLNCISIGSYCK